MEAMEGGDVAEEEGVQPAAAAPALPAEVPEPATDAGMEAAGETAEPPVEPAPKRQRIPIPLPPAPPPQTGPAYSPPPAPLLKPSTAFLSHYLTGLERGNERRVASDTIRAGLAAMGQAAQAAARPLLQLAAVKGEAAVQRAALQVAWQARQAACVGTLQEVARVYGFQLSVHIGEAAEAAGAATVAQGADGNAQPGGSEAEEEQDVEEEQAKEPEAQEQEGAQLPSEQQASAAHQQPLRLAPLAVQLRLQPPERNGVGKPPLQDTQAASSRQEAISAARVGSAVGGRLAAAAFGGLGASPLRPSSRQGTPAASPSKPAASATAAQPPAAAPPAGAECTNDPQAASKEGDGAATQGAMEVPSRKRQHLAGSSTTGGLFGAALAGLGSGRPT